MSQREQLALIDTILGRPAGAPPPPPVTVVVPPHPAPSPLAAAAPPRKRKGPESPSMPALVPRHLPAPAGINLLPAIKIDTAETLVAMSVSTPSSVAEDKEPEKEIPIGSHVLITSSNKRLIPGIFFLKRGPWYNCYTLRDVNLLGIQVVRHSNIRIATEDEEILYKDRFEVILTRSNAHDIAESEPKEVSLHIPVAAYPVGSFVIMRTDDGEKLGQTVAFADPRVVAGWCLRETTQLSSFRVSISITSNLIRLATPADLASRAVEKATLSMRVSHYTGGVPVTNVKPRDREELIKMQRELLTCAVNSTDYQRVVRNIRDFVEPVYAKGTLVMALFNNGKRAPAWVEKMDGESFVVWSFRPSSREFGRSMCKADQLRPLTDSDRAACAMHVAQLESLNERPSSSASSPAVPASSS